MYTIYQDDVLYTERQMNEKRKNIPAKYEH